MHLLPVRVEGFRSLALIEIELQPHTALFGENDAGVGCLLDVLARALDRQAKPQVALKLIEALGAARAPRT